MSSKHFPWGWVGPIFGQTVANAAVSRAVAAALHRHSYFTSSARSPSRLSNLTLVPSGEPSSPPPHGVAAAPQPARCGLRTIHILGCCCRACVQPRCAARWTHPVALAARPGPGRHSHRRSRQLHGRCSRPQDQADAPPVRVDPNRSVARRRRHQGGAPLCTCGGRKAACAPPRLGAATTLRSGRRNRICAAPGSVGRRIGGCARIIELLFFRLGLYGTAPYALGTHPTGGVSSATACSLTASSSREGNTPVPAQSCCSTV